MTPAARKRWAVLLCLLPLGHVSAVAAGAPDPIDTVRPGIARLSFSGFYVRMKYCTAVQIGRRAALTVGFCLKADRYDQAQFVFGGDAEEGPERRAPRADFSDPDFSLLKLFCLNKALPPSPFESGMAQAAEGDKVFVAYFPAPDQDLVMRSCAVSRTLRPSEFWLDCASALDATGGAVFRQDGAQARLLGVIASGSERRTLVLGWTGKAPDDLCPF